MDSAITLADPRHPAPAYGSHRRTHAALEYRVIWALVFAASLSGGLLMRLAVRPVAALLRSATGDAGPNARAPGRDATLLGEARAAADAAAPFVFQVS